MINITQDNNRYIGKQLDDSTKANNVDSKAEDIKNQQVDSITNGSKVNNYSISGSTSSGTDFQSQSNGHAQGFGLGNIAFPQPQQALPVANGYTNIPNQQGNINKNIGQGLGNLGTYGWNKNLGNNVQSGKDYKISAGAELI